MKHLWELVGFALLSTEEQVRIIRVARLELVLCINPGPVACKMWFNVVHALS